MNALFLILKGMVIGIANVIPGVSGGTMAMSLGIYDRLIGCVSGLFKNFSKSLSFLLPILAGCGLGIIVFSYTIEYLLSEHTFVTCMAFVGLILGGLPAMWQQLKKSMHAKNTGSVGISGVLCFVIAFAVSGGMPLLKAGGDTLSSIPVTPANMVILFIIGIIAAATMVVPGVSGSMMLMILGYYYGVINAITGFLDALRAFDIGTMFHLALLLVPFGIGVLLGIFLIAKLITFLFENYGIQTYCAILGLVIASPLAIFINTGLFSELGTLTVPVILFGFILLAVGAVVTNLVGEKS